MFEFISSKQILDSMVPLKSFLTRSLDGANIESLRMLFQNKMENKTQEIEETKTQRTRSDTDLFFKKMEAHHAEKKAKLDRINELMKEFYEICERNSPEDPNDDTSIYEVTGEMEDFLTNWFEFKVEAVISHHKPKVWDKVLTKEDEDAMPFLENTRAKIREGRSGLIEYLKASNLLKDNSRKPTKVRSLQKEDQELERFPQEVEEEFGALQSENENYLAEIAKRDQLLCEKDREIEELKKKYQEIKETYEKTQGQVVKLEEMQEFNATMIKEKDATLEEFRDFGRELDGAFNRISALASKEDFIVKEEGGLEEVLSEKTLNVQEQNPRAREVPKCSSVNGKRNLDSLLASNEKNSEVSEVLSTRRRSKRGKEKTKKGAGF